MKYLFLLLLLPLTCVQAQRVVIKEIKFRANTRLYTIKDSTIIYPIVTTKNVSVNKLINDKIKEKIFEPESNKTSIKKAVEEQTSNGMTDLSYEVTYNKKGILSLHTDGEGCYAYCSTWSTYFNFDVNTGKEITIKDIIDEDKIDSFIKMVFSKKVSILATYKEEEKTALEKNEIDTATYNWILEQVETNCINTIDVEQFILSDTGISIMNPCEFPHVIRAIEPTFDLIYTYTSIATFLKPVFKKHLVK